MGWQMVSVYAFVPDSSGGGGQPGGGRPDPGYGVPGWPNQDLPRPPLGIWGPTDPRPSNPIYWPGFPGGGGRPPQQPGQPPVIWPGPNPPYIDIGFPGPQPGGPVYIDNTLPGNQPYPDQSLPGNQPYPDIGFPGNQPYPDQGLPGFQPYPDIGFPGNQPGLWPGRPPYVDIGFPGPQPGGPVYPDQSLPTIPGIRPTPPVYSPGPPSVDPDNMPEHPEVPDLNTGSWSWIQKPNSTETVAAFILWRGPVVTHPDYNPQYPPDATQPGMWVLTVAGNRPAWAWIPDVPQSSGGSDQPRPDRDRPDEQEKAAAKK